MPTITTAKPAELVSQVIIDNTAGGAFDYTLIEFDSATNLVTLGDGSQNDVTKWIQDRLVTVYNNAPAAQISFTAACRAILNIQNLAPGGAQLAQVVTLVGSVFAFKVTIPAGYNSAFLWGATQSIDGGFALSGAYPAGTSVTLPVSAANGGLGTNASAFKGVVKMAGGTAGVYPALQISATAGTEAGDVIKVTFTATNAADGSAITSPINFWIEQASAGTFTIADGGAGTVAYDAIATTGRARLSTDASGVCELDVGDALAETITIAWGDGPGASIAGYGFIFGGNINLTFA